MASGDLGTILVLFPRQVEQRNCVRDKTGPCSIQKAGCRPSLLLTLVVFSLQSGQSWPWSPGFLQSTPPALSLSLWFMSHRSASLPLSESLKLVCFLPPSLSRPTTQLPSHLSLPHPSLCSFPLSSKKKKFLENYPHVHTLIITQSSWTLFKTRGQAPTFLGARDSEVRLVGYRDGCRKHCAGKKVF